MIPIDPEITLRMKRSDFGQLLDAAVSRRDYYQQVVRTGSSFDPDDDAGVDEAGEMVGVYSELIERLASQLQTNRDGDD